MGVYNSAITAMKDLREGHIQLLFLDIQMPELSGLEFAKILPKETRCIFTTAFPQYAIESFRVSAIDYLLKPISFDDFQIAVNKAVAHFALSHHQQDRFFFIKSDYQLQRINFDEILYIEGQKDYVRIYLENGQKIMSLMNMKTLEDFLPRPEFMRIHRSFIAHVSKVDVIDRMRFVYGDTHIPVSDSYKDAVNDIIDKFTLT